MNSPFKPVPLPVDVTDERAFPEIAAARRHLEELRRKQRERKDAA